MGEVIPKAEERKIWNIVVEANCFLDEESRRSLQLLEGLKGTHLIVPRIGKLSLILPLFQSNIFMQLNISCCSLVLQS